MLKKEIFLSVMMLLLVGCAPSDSSSETGPFITANPMDLSQIASISPYRSCVGHDYSGYNIDGEKETLRSMKHYVDPLPDLIGTDTIKIFAPFDGEISRAEESFPGTQVSLEPSAGIGHFIFFHVTLLPELRMGSKVTSGQNIGYVSKDIRANFDIGIRQFGFKQKSLSPFNFMEQSVLDEYAARGVTLENIILSKEERDANPCPISDYGPEGDANFPPGSGQDEYVDLT